jgi:hypothetical protein
VADPNNKKRIAQLLRMIGSSGGERRNAFAALERAMRDGRATWTDVGDAYERSADGEYSKAEMQEFAQAARALGVEEGIKIGQARARAYDISHVVLPRPAEMAEFCHRKLSRLKNDWQRDFVTDIFVITRHAENLSLLRLANLAKIYIEIGGRI